MTSAPEPERACGFKLGQGIGASPHHHIQSYVHRATRVPVRALDVGVPCDLMTCVCMCVCMCVCVCVSE
jgi:hypothetical protein